MVIDEIKTTAAPTDAIREDMNPCHWAQGIVYGAICAEQRELETLDVRLTYYQIDTDEIIRYTRTSPPLSWMCFSTTYCGSIFPGHGGSWTGWKPGTGALGPCNFRFRPTVPGSAPLPGRSIAPVLRARQSRRAVPGCSARHPPASAKR